MDRLPGYSQAELDEAQEWFNLRFPPDLLALLRERRIPRGYDWTMDADRIRQMLAWPIEGLLFDVEHAGLWWPEWGERPRTPRERAQIVSDVARAAPKLIPLFGHRFIPEEPCEAGDPVFSVHQSDIIHYGADLWDYLSNEFSRPHRLEIRGALKPIRFWSDAVDRAWDEAYYPYSQA